MTDSDQAVDEAALALGAAGYLPGCVARRRKAVQAALDRGVSAADVKCVAEFAARTQLRPGALLVAIFGRDGDVVDAVACARAAESLRGVVEAKERELEIRERELVIKEAEERRRQMAERVPSYYLDDPNREKNPIKREGFDVTTEDGLVEAYKAGHRLHDLAFWCGRSTVEARQILGSHGVDLRRGDDVDIW